MRPQFVFTLLIAAGGILGAAFYLKQHLRSPSSPPPAIHELAIPAPAVDSNAETRIARQPAIEPLPITPVVADAVTPEQRQAAIDAETDRLRQVSMSDDPAALPPILADLTNPEKDVRDAAINAAREFGSKDAIPALKAAV